MDSSAASSMRMWGKSFTEASEEAQNDMTVPAELFISELPDDIRCPVCMEYALVPRTLSCQHAFCKACIVSHGMKGPVGGRDKCPVCRATTVRSQAVSRLGRTMMHNATFRCHERGCFWQGKGLDAAKAHWATCELAETRGALAHSAVRGVVLRRLNSELQADKDNMTKTIDGHGTIVADLKRENREICVFLLSLYDESVAQAKRAAAGEIRAVEELSKVQAAMQAALNMKAALQIALAEGEANMHLLLSPGMFNPPQQAQKRERPSSSAAWQGDEDGESKRMCSRPLSTPPQRVAPSFAWPVTPSGVVVPLISEYQGEAPRAATLVAVSTEQAEEIAPPLDMSNLFSIEGSETEGEDIEA